ncbi:alpha/beta hydrolase [Lysobacter firmicutimachus]|uniref:Alpha/beta fold hydrolase n=1 Tax=Lysobacter firmicutimachus TaxID=1792846 RepID=A0ABU8D7W7_9GAMM
MSPSASLPSLRHVLLIHGAGGGGWEWNLWAPVLAARGLVVAAPDLQPAPAGLEGTHWPDYLDQVRTALEALPRPRAVVGASLGGLLAWVAADRAEALVLVNPLLPAPWATRLPTRDWPPRVAWHSQARLASTRRAIAEADDAAALYAFRRWRDESGAVLRAAHAGIAAPAPACPVLCLSSRTDRDVPPALVAEFAAAVGAQHRTLATAGHVDPLLGRGAAAIATEVADWLTGG